MINNIYLGICHSCKKRTMFLGRIEPFSWKTGSKKLRHNCLNCDRQWVLEEESLPTILSGVENFSLDNFREKDCKEATIYLNETFCIEDLFYLCSLYYKKNGKVVFWAPSIPKREDVPIPVFKTLGWWEFRFMLPDMCSILTFREHFDNTVFVRYFTKPGDDLIYYDDSEIFKITKDICTFLVDYANEASSGFGTMLIAKAELDSESKKRMSDSAQKLRDIYSRKFP